MIPLERPAWSWYYLTIRFGFEQLARAVIRFGFEQLARAVLFERASVILSYLLFVA
jgi:hypothetical protein